MAHAPKWPLPIHRYRANPWPLSDVIANDSKPANGLSGAIDSPGHLKAVLGPTGWKSTSFAIHEVLVFATPDRIRAVNGNSLGKEGVATLTFRTVRAPLELIFRICVRARTITESDRKCGWRR